MFVLGMSALLGFYAIFWVLSKMTGSKIKGAWLLIKWYGWFAITAFIMVVCLLLGYTMPLITENAITLSHDYLFWWDTTGFPAFPATGFMQEHNIFLSVVFLPFTLVADIWWFFLTVSFIHPHIAFFISDVVFAAIYIKWYKPIFDIILGVEREAKAIAAANTPKVIPADEIQFEKDAQKWMYAWYARLPGVKFNEKFYLKMGTPFELNKPNPVEFHLTELLKRGGPMFFEKKLTAADQARFAYLKDRLGEEWATHGYFENNWDHHWEEGISVVDQGYIRSARNSYKKIYGCLEY